jgi:hypothetical protein
VRIPVRSSAPIWKRISLWKGVVAVSSKSMKLLESSFQTPKWVVKKHWNIFHNSSKWRSGKTRIFRCKCKNGISSPWTSDILLTASDILPNVISEQLNVEFIYKLFLYGFFKDIISRSKSSNYDVINELELGKNVEETGHVKSSP